MTIDENMPESDNQNYSEEPTEMTAMTGCAQSEASAVSFLPTGTSSVGGSDQLKKAWLKRQLRTPAGKCVLFFAFLGFIILISYLVTKIIIGIMYMSECSQESFIPAYLVASSILLLIFIGLLITLVVKYHGRAIDDDRISPIHLVSLVYYFIHLVLQLAGSVCVIRSYSQMENEPIMADTGSTVNGLTLDPSPVCNPTLLTFAFGVVIFELVLSGLCFLLTILTLAEVIYFVCFK